MWCRFFWHRLLCSFKGQLHVAYGMVSTTHKDILWLQLGTKQMFNALLWIKQMPICELRWTVCQMVEKQKENWCFNQKYISCFAFFVLKSLQSWTHSPSCNSQLSVGTSFPIDGWPSIQTLIYDSIRLCLLRLVIWAKTYTHNKVKLSKSVNYWSFVVTLKRSIFHGNNAS